MTYRVLAVDDELPARSQVARMVRRDGRCELVGEACDGLDALRKIEALQPNILILDVQMPRASGFDVLAALGPRPDLSVVFATAHDAHALRAFEAHAVDYLLKPYDQERFVRALDKACAQLIGGQAGLDYTTAVRAARRLVVQADELGWVALEASQILRLRAANKHVAIVTPSRELLVRAPLSELALRLDPATFARVHRGEIVNLHAVEHVQPSSHGDARLRMADGATVWLTRSYRAGFLARYRALEATGSAATHFSTCNTPTAPSTSPRRKA